MQYAKRNSLICPNAKLCINSKQPDITQSSEADDSQLVTSRDVNPPASRSYLHTEPPVIQATHLHDEDPTTACNQYDFTIKQTCCTYNRPGICVHCHKT
jgi:hypothetical protein